MKIFFSKIIKVEFYRNFPFVDQTSGTPFFKKLFPFHFQKIDLGYRSSLWIEFPFVAAKVKIRK